MIHLLLYLINAHAFRVNNLFTCRCETLDPPLTSIGEAIERTAIGHVEIHLLYTWTEIERIDR